MALNGNQAVRLARALRALRETSWPERELTQAQLAKALSSEGRVAGATLSSWESLTNPETPSESPELVRMLDFFARSDHSRANRTSSQKISSRQAELDRFRELESQLLELFYPEDRKVRRTFLFDAGPVIVICPTAPTEVQGPLADVAGSQLHKLRQYGDLDALIELYGHLRAENPSLDVFHRLTTDIVMLMTFPVM